MSQVSEGGAELFTRLVEWEMFAREDVCPKELLRTISLADLAIASKGLEARGGLGQFVSAQMVEAEMYYRTGKIREWSYVRDGDDVTLAIETKHADLKHTVFSQEARA